MRLWTILLLASAAMALAPSASAHDCNGYGCGPCPRGETHHHNDWTRGQCASGPGYYGENGYGGQRAEWSGGYASNGHDGQRFVPGAALLGTLGVLAGVALLLRGRSP